MNVLLEALVSAAGFGAVKFLTSAAFQKLQAERVVRASVGRWLGMY